MDKEKARGLALRHYNDGARLLDISELEPNDVEQLRYQTAIAHFACGILALLLAEDENVSAGDTD
jgi:hypothetical protein